MLFLILPWVAVPHLGVNRRIGGKDLDALRAQPALNRGDQPVAGGSVPVVIAKTGNVDR
jgi:hypothetical protein